jgi:hypothetical protein
MDLIVIGLRSLRNEQLVEEIVTPQAVVLIRVGLQGIDRSAYTASCRFQLPWLYKGRIHRQSECLHFQS